MERDFLIRGVKGSGTYSLKCMSGLIRLARLLVCRLETTPRMDRSRPEPQHELRSIVAGRGSGRSLILFADDGDSAELAIFVHQEFRFDAVLRHLP